MEGTNRARKPIVARLLAALTAAGIAAALGLWAGVARGEPSCSDLVPGLFINLNDVVSAECRQVNEAVAEKHEEKRHWVQVAGARHPDEAVPEGSPTPYEADLFSVRFRDSKTGLAGGAICAEPVAPDEVEDCERVPVIYSHTEEQGWQRVELPGADEPGYVGGLAWIRKGEALAVGGTGTYPRREFNPPGTPDNPWGYDARAQNDVAEGAGTARAWHLRDGEWEEITDELPTDEHGDPMGALNTLDIWVGREPDGDEWGLAGGYGQIWEWEGGRFTGSHLDRETPSFAPGSPCADPEWCAVKGSISGVDVSDPSFFQFRVREVRIAPDPAQKWAFAFTAGCCGRPEDGTSRMLEFHPRPSKGNVGIIPASAAPPPEQRPHWYVYKGGGANGYGDSVYSFALRSERVGVHADPADEHGEPRPEPGSRLWGVDLTVSSGRPGLVIAPGGPAQPDEEGPRLVASDGDTEPTATPSGQVTGNGTPDWLVGEDLSGEPALRRAGLIKTTVRAYRPEYGGIRPYCDPPARTGTQNGGGSVAGSDEVSVFFNSQGPGNGPAGPEDIWICRTEQVQTGKQPELDDDGPLRTRESGLQRGPSWALNAIEMLDAENVGYAVGDRGAVVRFGAPVEEPDPAPVGARRPEKLADRSAYADAVPPPAGSVGEVPPLAAQPRERSDELELVRVGSPDASEAEWNSPSEDARTIVMSRDGSEGWAIGPSPEATGGSVAFTDDQISVIANGGVMALYHYQGDQWTRCDPVGIRGLVEPDGACAGLADIYRRKDPDGNRIRLTAAARVPLENDDDPTNDDEFEVVAVGMGTEYEQAPDELGNITPRTIPVMLRYREGRWQLEDKEVRRSLNPAVSILGFYDNMAISSYKPREMVFASPEEGWLSVRSAFNTLLLR